MDLHLLHDVAETIGGFSAGFALLAVIVAILAHRKTSRDKAIEILLEWTRHFATIDALLLNLAYQLEDHGTEEQIQSLSDKKPFKLESFQEDIFKQGIPSQLSQVDENGTTTLRVEFAGSVRIRAVVVSYLNMIECALAAARHTSANTDIIHKEFGGFYDPKTGKAVFQRFRSVSESNARFPSIALFEDKLRKELGSFADPVFKTERLQRQLLSTFTAIDQDEINELKLALERRLSEFKKWTNVAASISILSQFGVAIDSDAYQRRWASEVPVTEMTRSDYSSLTDSEAISIIRGRLDERDSPLFLSETLRRVLTGEGHPSTLCRNPWLKADWLSKTLLKVNFQDIVYLLRETWMRTEKPSPDGNLDCFRKSLALALDTLDREHPGCRIRTSFIRTGQWKPNEEQRDVVTLGST